jgi:hypothetical protein
MRCLRLDAYFERAETRCINSRFKRDEQYGGCAAAGTREFGEASRARTRTSPTGARPLARMSVAPPVLSPATHPVRPAAAQM